MIERQDHRGQTTDVRFYVEDDEEKGYWTVPSGEVTKLLISMAGYDPRIVIYGPARPEFMPDAHTFTLLLKYQLPDGEHAMRMEHCMVSNLYPTAGILCHTIPSVGRHEEWWTRENGDIIHTVYQE